MNKGRASPGEHNREKNIPAHRESLYEVEKKLRTAKQHVMTDEESTGEN